MAKELDLLVLSDRIPEFDMTLFEEKSLCTAYKLKEMKKLRKCWSNITDMRSGSERGDTVWTQESARLSGPSAGAAWQEEELDLLSGASLGDMCLPERPRKYVTFVEPEYDLLSVRSEAALTRSDCQHAVHRLQSDKDVRCLAACDKDVRCLATCDLPDSDKDVRCLAACCLPDSDKDVMCLTACDSPDRDKHVRCLAACNKPDFDCESRRTCDLCSSRSSSSCTSVEETSHAYDTENDINLLKYCSTDSNNQYNPIFLT